MLMSLDFTWGRLFSSTSVTVELIIWGLYIGFVVACAGMAYAKRVPGKIIRALEGKQAFSEETAVTLEEIGFNATSRVKKALAFGSVPRKYICALDDEATVVEPKTSRFAAFLRKVFIGEKKRCHVYDFSKQRWYLAEEKRHQAALRYDPKGCNVQMVVITAIILFVIALALSFLAPDLVKNFKEAIHL